MPGYELIGEEELKSLTQIFRESNGVLFAHAHHDRRKGIYRVRNFEKAVENKIKANHCVAVNSGTAAGYLALKALGVGPGDEVITQAFTFVATVEDILLCGATPVVVNVDETLNMCPQELAKAITPKTKCIFPVHMLGNPVRMDEIMAIASKHDLPVVEDACESLGATYKGRPVGTIGEIGVYSLDFNKTITTGEGGLVVTNNPKLKQEVLYLHDHGHWANPELPRGQELPAAVGFNFRMTEMQAAVGISQLEKIDLIVRKNRENKAKLKAALTASIASHVKFREITDVEGDLSDTLIFYMPTKEKAQNVAKALAKVGVGTKNLPDALTWHFAENWGHMWKDSPLYANSYKQAWARSRELLERSISLPIMVLSTEAEIKATAEKVIQAVIAS